MPDQKSGVQSFQDSFRTATGLTEEQKAAKALAATSASAKLAPPDDGDSPLGMIADGFIDFGKAASEKLGLSKPSDNAPLPGDNSGRESFQKSFRKSTGK